MKYLETYEKYAPKLKLKKYVVLEPFYNPGFEDASVLLIKILEIEDKFSKYGNNDILIKYEKTFEVKDNGEVKFIKDIQESTSYFNIKNRIRFQSDDEFECIEFMKMFFTTKKYNL